MDIRFLYPLYFFLLLALPLVWWRPPRSNTVMSPGRKSGRRGLLQRGWRTLLLSALILALTRPVLLSSQGEPYRVFIIDRSASVSPLQQRRGAEVLEKLLAQMPDRDKVSLIELGSARDVQEPMTNAEAIRIRSTSSSSLSTALQAANQTIPMGSQGSITLISDGLATDRHWGPVLQALIQRGIAVNTFDLDEQISDVYPSRIRTDVEARVGQTMQVIVDVIGTAAELRVRLSNPDGELVLSEPVSSAGRVAVALEFEPSAAGFLHLTAEVIVTSSGDDADPDNNRLNHVVPIQDPLRVLYLGWRQTGGAAKLQTLLGAGFAVTAADPANLAADLGQALQQDSHHLVILDDVPAAQLPTDLQQQLAVAVNERGLGLLYSGGEASFGDGGLERTVLADALPVEFIQREEKKTPSVALAIIVDTSGSMAGRRLILAKQFARLATRRLRREDWIGIVEFHGAKRWALPMMPASNNVQIERAISRLSDGGSTVLYPALQEAHYGLKNLRTRYKHILLITDGDVEQRDFESAVRRMAKDGITVSSVHTGSRSIKKNLLDLSLWGKGRYFNLSNQFQMVDLILKQPSTDKPPAYRRGDFDLVARGGTGWWGPVEPSGLPALKGYVEVKARPSGEVLMEERDRGHPLLATWHYGLGRVTSLMTEPLGEGTAPWQQWQDYGALLGRIVGRTASGRTPFRYWLERDGDQLRISAERHNRAGALQPAVALVSDENVGTTAIGEFLQFTQQSPNRFEATLTSSPARELRLLAGVVGQETAQSPEVRTTDQRLVSMVAADTLLERQVDPLMGLDLERLARATGGISLEGSAPMPLESALASGTLTLIKFWPYVLLLALLAYLGELVYRRWPKA